MRSTRSRSATPPPRRKRMKKTKRSTNLSNSSWCVVSQLLCVRRLDIKHRVNGKPRKAISPPLFRAKPPVVLALRRTLPNWVRLASLASCSTPQIAKCIDCTAAERSETINTEIERHAGVMQEATRSMKTAAKAPSKVLTTSSISSSVERIDAPAHRTSSLASCRHSKRISSWRTPSVQIRTRRTKRQATRNEAFVSRCMHFAPSLKQAVTVNLDSKCP